MRSAISLVIIAFVIAAIWRVEVELRGWSGLTWLGYTHLAIPMGGLLFLGWVWWMAREDARAPRIVFFTLGWGTAAWFWLEYAARAYFVGGPTAFYYMVTLGSLYDHMQWLSPAMWGGAILILFTGYRLLFPFPVTVWIASLAIWLGSWHLGLAAIHVVPERGSPDLIHSLKTGWMIPFCVIAAGLPLLWLRRERGSTGTSRVRGRVG